MVLLTRCSTSRCSVTSKVFCAHAVTSWGDRMWNFAISIFFVKMAGTYSLRLTAVYGLVCCASTIALGTAIGRWIDTVPRMTAAVKSLVVQNSSVVICAVILCIVIHFDLEGSHLQQRSWPYHFAQVLVIFFGALANLASMATNISISKDWVVVIAEKDKEKLAAVNAMCRTIDLTTKICSPLLVGCIMSRMSNLVAAIFIASWNIVSMIVEYRLLCSIYNSVPALAHKNNRPEDIEKNIDAKESCEEQETERGDKILQPLISKMRGASRQQPLSQRLSSMFMRNLSNYRLSWKNYFEHDIFMAGLSFACLYLTVLAFDGITIGYAFSQGISETVLGVLGGCGALVGIMGTYAYPKLRRRIGLECTGFVGFLLEVSCLVLCVAAVWAPGSPFDPSCIMDSSSPSCLTSSEAVSTTGSTSNYISVVLLMTGITMARFGLWITDLTVNQIIQEEVKESQRGSISGSQYSLNMTMNFVKFCLVIMLPYPKTFGVLALISFTVICLGWLCYCIYCRRKHIRTFSALKLFCCWQSFDFNSTNATPISGEKVI